MMVEAGGSGALAVAFLPIASDGDQYTAGRFRRRSQLLCQRIAVHVRLADIKQADVRCFSPRPGQRRSRFVFDHHFTTGRLKQHGEHRSGIDIVVHD